MDACIGVWYYIGRICCLDLDVGWLEYCPCCVRVSMSNYLEIEYIAVLENKSGLYCQATQNIDLCVLWRGSSCDICGIVD